MSATSAPAILLMGPTAAGKTALAVELVRRFPLEILSVDSAMVYRGLDIGTAKPDAATRAVAPHHLIDLIEPTEPYSAGQFLGDAADAERAVRARGRVPLYVGGTMLYFRALQSGLARLPARDPGVRAAIDARAEREGWPALHAELARVDPASAARIGPADRQRIQRALEVHALTGRPLSSLQAEDLRAATGSALKLVVAPAERAVLHERIAARLTAMMAAGFAEEVRALHARGDLNADLPALRSVGYRQLWAWCDGQCGLDAAVEAATVATRQLAKRQLTWLRAEPGADWVDPARPEGAGDVYRHVEAWLGSVTGP